MIDSTELRMVLYVIAFGVGMLIATYIGREPTQAEYATVLIDAAFAEIGGD